VAMNDIFYHFDCNETNHLLWAEHWKFQPRAKHVISYFKKKFPGMKIDGTLTNGYYFYFKTEKEKLWWMLKHL
jgi:hypothetical protein